LLQAASKLPAAGNAGTSDLLNLSASGGQPAYSGILVDVLGDLQSSLPKEQTPNSNYDSVVSNATNDDTFNK